MKRRGALRFFGYIFVICIMLVLMIVLLNFHARTTSGSSGEGTMETEAQQENCTQLLQILFTHELPCLDIQDPSNTGK